MYHEFCSIVICRITYIIMQQHRFVFNLGYTGADGSEAMSTAAVLFTSMFLELCFEFVIDTITLQIESAHGIR